MCIRYKKKFNKLLTGKNKKNFQALVSCTHRANFELKLFGFTTNKFCFVSTKNTSQHTKEELKTEAFFTSSVQSQLAS